MIAPAPAPPPVTDTPPVRWVEVARWCMARDGGRLSNAEVGFLFDLDQRGDVDLSPRQAAWLATIYAELRLDDPSALAVAPRRPRR